MAILNSFSSGSTISSTAMNANFTDVASEITGSLPRDGQAAMTGQLKSASGSVALPGIAFSADLDNGFYRIGADNIGFSCGGTKLLDFSSALVGVTGALTATTTITAATVAATAAMTKGGVAVEAFASGTAMLFVQTSAPTGWTKSTTHNDKALRVVSGTASSGGSVAFTTAFASQTPAGTVGDTTLTTNQIPSHQHFVAADNSSSTTALSAANYMADQRGSAAEQNYLLSGTATVADNGLTSGTGGGASHTHTFTGNAINLAVSYVDTIIATKD